MAMFPLLNRKSDAGSRAYVTLDEALVSGTARVSEVSDGGSVPELLFRNLGERPVLLVEGEELVGAKQNRTLNISILAPAGRETRIPVTCVEAGRWGYGDGVEFQRSDRAHYARGRRTKREAVNQNMSHDPGSRAADQGAVWEDIDAKMAAMSARSDTGAMGDIYEQEPRVARRLRSLHSGSSPARWARCSWSEPRSRASICLRMKRRSRGCCRSWLAAMRSTRWS